MPLKLKTCASAFVLGAAVLAAGCGTKRTFVDYNRSSLYSTENAGNVPYIEIGPVTASQRGFFWEPCWQLAENAVNQLRASAEERGANSIIAMRWLNHATGAYGETPMCTTGWGWFTAFILPGFGPWVQATEVRGRLVRADDSRLTGLKQQAGQSMAEHQRRQSQITPPPSDVPAPEAPPTPADAPAP